MSGAGFGMPMEMPHTEAALRDARSASTEMRWIAAMALGQEDGPLRPRAVEALVSLASDPQEDVRAQAIEALAAQSRGGARVSADGASGWLDDPSDLVRCAAVTNADAFSLDADAVAARAIADGSAAVRATAARSLGHRGGAGVADAIAALLLDPSPVVRTEAALALSRLGDDRGVPLSTALLDEGGEDAVEAAQALGFSKRPLAPQALLRATARAFGANDLKAIAAAALARCGDARGKAIVARMLASWRRRTRFAAAHALAALPSPGLAAEVGARIPRADAMEASILVQTLAAIGDEEPGEVLAALRAAAAAEKLAAGVAEEIAEAVRELAGRAG